MNTLQEVQQDSAAEQMFTRRERILTEQRESLSRQVKTAEQKARRLHARLAELDSEAPATAELTGALEDIEEDLDWLRYGARYQLVADALSVVYEDGSGEYSYTPADVKAWCERAVEFDAAHPRIDADQIADLMRLNILPNAPFRARVLELLARGMTMDQITVGVWFALSQIEEAEGFDYGSKNLVAGEHRKPQSRELERQLGLQAKEYGGSKSQLVLFVSYELGVALMRALGMSPQAAGL